MNHHKPPQVIMENSFAESILKLHHHVAPAILPLPGPYAKRIKPSDHTPELKKDKVAIFWRSMENVIKSLLTTGVLLGLLLVYDHRQALAASGGRMGGRSSRSSSSSSSSSRSSSRSSSGSYSRSYSSRPSYSSSGSYVTQTSSPAPINSEKVEPKNVFRNIVMTVFVLALIVVFVQWCDYEINTPKTSVLKLQVGSLGKGRSLQRELNRIAEKADTSTLKGLNYVLQETIVALLRHSNYCISGYSSVDVKRSVKEGEKLFDQLSIEERSKFDEETLVNVNNNIRKKTATTHTSNGLLNQYIVVTILVVASCVPELPPIKSNEQLKKALQNLASIPTTNIIGVEVLWTPQKEDDSLTEQEMLEDYPLLHPL
ncbi:hypothetical protein SSX86_017544 [Deinandra increscens subsp. villosa]|uniref:Uncharacterized protein n=1 Tax=Deinandra increscens subsp. villosa TaxID=3103831 RepID=A0AAP0GUC6_9ASTR